MENSRLVISFSRFLDKCVGLHGNYWAKMVGKVEELGVKTHKDGLKLGIEMLEPNLVKKELELEIGWL